MNHCPICSFNIIMLIAIVIIFSIGAYFLFKNLKEDEKKRLLSLSKDEYREERLKRLLKPKWKFWKYKY